MLEKERARGSPLKLKGLWTPKLPGFLAFWGAVQSLQPKKRKTEKLRRDQTCEVKESVENFGQRRRWSDQAVRDHPESAYEPEFYERLAERNQWINL